ncbi:zinc-binding dehydrogenase [Curtobacterium flaccumfaciens]|nr:zinc-binding dehydrogenase [Curtobacterium flaccumfaciens]
MAARAAMLLGAEQVIVIDRLPERLRQVREHSGAETLDYTSDAVLPELKERTGGRGPDVCIEAVGMEAHGTGPLYLYDQAKQQLRLQTDRPTALREAIYACRKGGSLFSLRGLRWARRQVPVRRDHEQGHDGPRRPAARAPLHPDDPRPHRRGRAQHRAPRHARDATVARAARVRDVQEQGRRLRPRRLHPRRVMTDHATERRKERS